MEDRHHWEATQGGLGTDSSWPVDKRRRLEKWLASDHQAPRRVKGAAQRVATRPKLPVTDAAETADYRPLLDGGQGEKATGVVNWDDTTVTTAASTECPGIRCEGAVSGAKRTRALEGRHQVKRRRLAAAGEQAAVRAVSATVARCA